jgi:hypothetical protein
MSSLQQNWRKGQNIFCLEAMGGGGRWRRWRTEGRNDPNIVCTYEYMNKEKKTVCVNIRHPHLLFISLQ